jgi:hypothetical protein
MSLLKRLGAFSALIVAGLALASSASAATTLSTTAFAAGLGTPAAPQPVAASLTTTIDNDGATPISTPVAQTASLVQTLPAEFANNLAGFGSCPETSFDDEKTAPGGAEDPSVSCPANSLVGNGALKLVAKLGPKTVLGASERVVIVKDATTGGLAFWASYTVETIRFSKIIHGTLGTNATGQTVITWDPTSVEPTVPLTVKLLEFSTAYNANQTGLAALEPFANTGCAAGTWAFSVLGSFVGGAPAAETANSTAACNTTPPVPGTVTIGSKTVKVSSSGKGKFKVKCGVQGPCKGNFEITPKGKKSGNKKVVLARGGYSIAAGATAQISFTLTGKGKSVLAKHDGKQAARLKLLPTGGTPVSGSLQLKQS